LVLGGGLFVLSLGVLCCDGSFAAHSAQQS
jgi:hypothetical protein